MGDRVVWYVYNIIPSQKIEFDRISLFKMNSEFFAIVAPRK